MIKEEKRTPATPKEKTVKLSLDWKIGEYSIEERLPEWFLQSKLKEDQRYIPIHLYREIMRQIDEFGVPQFSIPEKFATGKNKSGTDMITYRVVCTVEWHKNWKKDPIILTGTWYSAMSWGTLLSDAIHGNVATLDAKALRSALKHSYRIFEYPEMDVVDVPTPGTVNEIRAAKTIEEIAKAMPWVPEEPVTDIENNIREEYATQKALLDKNLAEMWTDKPTKSQILSIATDLKNKFGEEYKKFITPVIMNDLNSAI